MSDKDKMLEYIETRKVLLGDSLKELKVKIPTRGKLGGLSREDVMKDFIEIQQNQDLINITEGALLELEEFCNFLKKV